MGRQQRKGCSPKKETSANGQKWILVLAISTFSTLYGITGDSRHSNRSFQPSVSMALSTYSKPRDSVTTFNQQHHASHMIKCTKHLICTYI